MNISAKTKLYFNSLIRGDSFLSMAVSPILAIYRGIVWLVFKLYSSGFLKSHKVEAKVISVGNITFGGSGKTPLVEFLAKRLSANGKKVAVSIRGYGNDEKDMLKGNLKGVPVLIGQDRVRECRQAVNQHRVKVIILDDGFQHLRLARDLDIVTIDCMDLSEDSAFMPSGILREPLSGLKRADIFVLTRSDVSNNAGKIREYLNRINKDTPVFESYYRPFGLSEYLSGQMIDCNALEGERVALLSAIGNPRYFKKVAEAASLNIAREFIFPDHYDYVPSDIQDISDECTKDGITHLVTTQKDMVKLERLIDEDFPKQLKPCTLLIEVVIKDEEGFLRAISRKL